MADTPRAFVAGWPIHHSRSPMIHGHWLEHHELAGSYERVGIEPDDFATFLTSLADQGYVGGNVTLPHKEAAFALVDEPDEAAHAIGAVNTVWLEDGKLYGSNTDAYGFLANLDQTAPGWDSPERRARGALVLGAGGAARAIIHALQQREFAPVWIANRTVERAESLASEFGGSCRAISIADALGQAGSATLITNTTSVGMNSADAPLSLNGFESESTVCDIVYTPLETTLLAHARTCSMTAVDGLGMLLHQAVPGFERWFGVRPEVTDDLRNLIVADIEAAA